MIPYILSEEDNNMLESIFTMEEVYQAIKNMDAKSAAGPNGFTGRFFVATWEIIGHRFFVYLRYNFLKISLIFGRLACVILSTKCSQGS